MLSSLSTHVLKALVSPETISHHASQHQAPKGSSCFIPNREKNHMTKLADLHKQLTDLFCLARTVF